MGTVAARSHQPQLAAVGDALTMENTRHNFLLTPTRRAISPRRGVNPFHQFHQFHRFHLQKRGAELACGLKNVERRMSGVEAGTADSW